MIASSQEIEKELAAIIPGFQLRKEEDITKQVKEAYENKEKEIGEKMMRQVERIVYLRALDTLWVEHLNSMEALREGIGLRGYGQRDPLVEYKQESYNLFQRYQQAIKNTILNTIYKVTVTLPPESEFGQRPLKEQGADESLSGGGFAAFAQGPTLAQRSGAANRNQVVRQGPKVGRNDPCPCGSGKKYKKCCLNKL